MNDIIKVFDFNQNLDQIKKDARRINTKVVRAYSHIAENNEIVAKKAYQAKLAEQLEKAPMSSKMHDYYNVFTFPYAGIISLYGDIVGAFKEVCEYDEPYVVHGWLNYQEKGEEIPWHYHWKGLSGLDRTYVATFYVNADPSITTYKYPDGTIVEKRNKNNQFCIFEDIGDIHKVSIWEQDQPRISISMDFVPMRYVQSMPYLLNTWMPIV